MKPSRTEAGQTLRLHTYLVPPPPSRCHATPVSIAFPHAAVGTAHRTPPHRAPLGALSVIVESLPSHALAQATAIAPPTDLRVNHHPPAQGTELLALQTGAPVFGWVLQHGRRGSKQTAYHIVVNQTSGGGSAVRWDSGEVKSPTSIGIDFAGTTQLPSDADFLWSAGGETRAGANLRSPPDFPLVSCTR